MTVSDPIADFIIQIKNAGAAGRESVVTPYSKMRIAVAELLKKEGYVGNVEKRGRKIKKSVEVEIRYDEDKAPRVRGVKRISKPSRRVYMHADAIRSVRQGHGMLVISTPVGVLSGEEAKKQGIGGEALFEIW